jgi:DNA primase
VSITRELVDEVRARADIVTLIGQSVTLKKKGSSFVGLCPFHNERTPSFNVVPARQIFHCFGCAAGGDIFSFLQKTRGISFVDAVKEVAASVGVTIEERPLTPVEAARVSRRNDIYGACEAACRHFENTLLVGASGGPGRDYLKTRGLSVDTARRYRLGFAPEGWNNLENHLRKEGFDPETLLKAGLVKQSERGTSTYDVFRGRFIFPILDDRGRPIAFGGRVLPGADKDAPKYLNSPGTEIYDKSKVLYGLSYARGAVQRKDRLIVVEGYFDAVSLWQAGFEEAVAPCGTALTAEQLEVVRRLTTRVVALFDTDEAGINAAVRALDLFLAAGIEARRLDLPGAKDPDEFLQKFGSTAFEARLGATEPLLELVIRRTLDKNGATLEGRARAVDALVPTLRKLEGTLRNTAIPRVAAWVGMAEAELLRRVGAGREEGPGPSPELTARWSPGNDLAHLLWLVVHHPARVRPELAAIAEPEMVSEHPLVLAAIARLIGDEPFADVLRWAEEAFPDLARVLARAAARSDLYSVEAAPFAARQILARLELQRVDQKILAIQREIRRCETTGDKSSYVSLVRELAGHQARQVQLKLTISRRAAALS